MLPLQAETTWPQRIGAGPQHSFVLPRADQPWHQSCLTLILKLCQQTEVPDLLLGALHLFGGFRTNSMAFLQALPVLLGLVSGKPEKGLWNSHQVPNALWKADVTDWGHLSITPPPLEFSFQDSFGPICTTCLLTLPLYPLSHLPFLLSLHSSFHLGLLITLRLWQSLAPLLTSCASNVKDTSSLRTLVSSDS